MTDRAARVSSFVICAKERKEEKKGKSRKETSNERAFFLFV